MRWHNICEFNQTKAKIKNFYKTKAKNVCIFEKSEIYLDKLLKEFVVILFEKHTRKGKLIKVMLSFSDKPPDSFSLKV